MCLWLGLLPSTSAVIMSDLNQAIQLLNLILLTLLKSARALAVLAIMLLLPLIALVPNLALDFAAWLEMTCKFP